MFQPKQDDDGSLETEFSETDLGGDKSGMPKGPDSRSKSMPK
jgi:hypothetical protein